MDARRTITRLDLGIMAASAFCAALVVGCTTDYQRGVDDPNFGPAGALEGVSPPPRTSDQGAGGSPGGNGGGTSVDGGAPIPEDQPVCVTRGGTVLDNGPCAVSFAKDVLDAFGQANCGDNACHGGLRPVNPPRIDPGDPAAMYVVFTTYKMQNSAPYVNPCSTDVTASGMYCNLDPAQPCGTRMPQGGTFADPLLAKIETWVKCGAPNN